jgi:hypothetical protein
MRCESVRFAVTVYSLVIALVMLISATAQPEIFVNSDNDAWQFEITSSCLPPEQDGNRLDG